MTQLTPFSDPDEVLLSIKSLVDRIHLGLHQLLPLTREWFDKQGLPVDKACHAMMTRFRLKHRLLAQQIEAEDEEELDDFSVEGASNCGLVIRGASCTLRLLKWRNGELPPSASKQRRDFYQFNLFAFETNDPFPDAPIPPLNLVAAWETNEYHELRSLAIVCPWGENQGRVQNKWMKTLDPAVVAPVPLLGKFPPEPQLDEITLKEPADFRSSGKLGVDRADDKIDGAS